MKKLDFKRFFRKLGPGFVSGAADDDPSGIATYAQTGAVFGYHQLWLSLFSTPFMIVIQEMCGRIGLVTGKGLAGVIKSHYSRFFLFLAIFLLFLANIVNIGADLGAMASSAQLIIGIPFWIWICIFTLGILLLQIYIPYKQYAKILKYLSFSLLAYIITLFLSKADWRAIIYSTFIPQFLFSKDFIFNIVAFLGTTISPYLFFWQSDEEVEEDIVKKRIRGMGKGIPKIYPRDLKEMKTDTIIGMFFSNLVSFFIIATTAATLHAHGITHIETAQEAALALRPFAGNFAFIFFTLGIIGTGLLAIPILAGSASYAISEAFGWSEGLGKKFNKARAFYMVIIVATLLGVLINFFAIPPFRMLYYSAILNGICAPPLIFFILKIGNNPLIMGKYTNSRFVNVLGFIIGFIMTFAVGILLWSIL